MVHQNKGVKNKEKEAKISQSINKQANDQGNAHDEGTEKSKEDNDAEVLRLTNGTKGQREDCNMDGRCTLLVKSWE